MVAEEAPEAAPRVAYVLPVGDVGTLAVYAVARGEVYAYARTAAQLALGYRDGRALAGPFGAFVRGRPSTDLERAIATRCPPSLE